jgi:hypothetical protein
MQILPMSSFSQQGSVFLDEGNAISTCFKIWWKYYFVGVLNVSQPHFWESVKMTLTLPKWGLGSPPGLPKRKSRIAGVKTPRIGVFFISLESYENLNVKNELAWAVWTFAAQVMCKRRARFQTGSLTPDH